MSSCDVVTGAFFRKHLVPGLRHGTHCLRGSASFVALGVGLPVVLLPDTITSMCVTTRGQALLPSNPVVRKVGPSRWANRLIGPRHLV